jgi:2,4-dienoyl-CoA reductase-like NADH-dependent reductase (Old Yellow Enzyme family)
MPGSPTSFRFRACRARRTSISPAKFVPHAKFPTFHAARIADVATARHAIASGKVDMVGMTRAHMTDPHIVRKIIEGREDDIRPCVGANYCLDRIYQGGAAYCIHNAATRPGTHHAARDCRAAASAKSW